jgi:aspartyl-tRNA(Asn)/glutamyl-tRNA(Gln) amidotransferase subunit A
MSDEDLCFTSAIELAARIRNRELSPVEVTRSVIERIERLEPELNAMAHFAPEQALDAARQAERAGSGPLHGVPVTIKDLNDVADMPTERGSWISKGNIAAQDTPFAARLRKAGAIILGKTTTSEYGWKGVSQSPLTGITHNPWRHGFNAGASSAGAAVAAAAGYGPLHQGSDGAGSIRMPAHFCGVFGHKPTFGRVPNVPVRNNDQTSHSGPLTRGVADAALMLEIMSGPHPGDHYSLEKEPEGYLAALDDGIAGARIGFSADLGHARVDEEVAAMVADAARVFGANGAGPDSVVTTFGPQGPEIVRFFWSAHQLMLAGHLEEYRDKMDPGLVACIESAESQSATDYLRMRERKHAYIADIHSLFESIDLLITPAVSVAAFPADRLMPEHWPQHEWDWLSWAEFSYPFNMSGNPAAIVPVGFTADGLPVGLQIVGRRFEDSTVLKAARFFERERPWAHARPPLR